MSYPQSKMTYAQANAIRPNTVYPSTPLRRPAPASTNAPRKKQRRQEPQQPQQEPASKRSLQLLSQVAIDSLPTEPVANRIENPVQSAIPTLICVGTRDPSNPNLLRVEHRLQMPVPLQASIGEPTQNHIQPIVQGEVVPAILLSVPKKDSDWTIANAIKKHLEDMLQVRMNLTSNFYSRKELNLYICRKWFETVDPNLLLESVEMRERASNMIERGNLVLSELKLEYECQYRLYKALMDERNMLRAMKPEELTVFELEHLQATEFKLKNMKTRFSYLTDISSKYRAIATQSVSLMKYALQKAARQEPAIASAANQ